jgi:hypothetical protein
MARLTRLAFPAAVLLFVAAPGHPDAWFGGVPVGLWTLVILALMAFAWAQPRIARPNLTRATAALAILVVAKIGVAALAPPAGWLGSYYTNGDFAGQPRQSTDFPRMAGATRIDRAIDFHDDYLPLYFLNDADFNRGIRREVTEPISIAWIGHVQADAATVLPLSVETRGIVRVVVDGGLALEATGAGPSRREVTLPPGDHVIGVRYIKPANTDPLVRLTGVTALVTPASVPHWKLAAAAPARAAARVVDVAAILVFAYAFVILLVGAAWSPVRVAAGAMLLLFIAQGLQAAVPLQQHAMTLSGGDDWLGFEARGRAVATGDLLMQYGQPLGKADVFYYYPGYSYFLAAVHGFAGEDLSTPIFVHFLLLFAANVLVFRLAERIFDRRTAIAALVFLVGIEELAFIRHYTVTLLSENLYFVTSLVTIDQLVRFVPGQRRGALAWAGLAGGVSSLIRPAMMMYLGPAVVVVAAVSVRVRAGARRAAAAVALFVAVWMAAVSPATIRNYVAAGQAVLITQAPAISFINYNLPPTADAPSYHDRYVNGSASVPRILAQILVDHPADTLWSIATKLGFSMGFLQLMGAHVHPELMAASIGYVLALLLCPAARSMQTWPIHAFVFAHLAGMVLTMPSNYGYRLILPMYLLFPMFAMHVAFEGWRRLSSIVSGRGVMPAASRTA